MTMTLDKPCDAEKIRKTCVTKPGTCQWDSATGPGTWLYFQARHHHLLHYIERERSDIYFTG